jgi:Secretion system C-terminal sorting domain
MIKSLLLITLLVFTVPAVSNNFSGLFNNTTTPLSRIVSCYPNPAISYINIDIQKVSAKNHSLLVYNFIGKKVADFNDINTHNRIDLTNFSRGIYIFQLKDPSGRVIESGKFQIEK